MDACYCPECHKQVKFDKGNYGPDSKVDVAPQPAAPETIKCPTCGFAAGVGSAEGRRLLSKPAAPRPVVELSGLLQRACAWINQISDAGVADATEHGKIADFFEEVAAATDRARQLTACDGEG